MTWRVVGCVLAHHDQKIGGVNLLVLLYLANHANGEDGSGAWPSQRTLASRTGVAYRTVQRALDRLVKAGAVEVEQRPGKTHRFRVRMCAVCLDSPSASQSHTPTNHPGHRVQGPLTQSPGTPDTESTEPLFYSSQESPTNAVGASPLDEASPRARPTGSDSQQPARNRKAAPPPLEQPQDGRAAFIERRVAEIRRDQGDRAARQYLATIAKNDAEDWRRAEVQRLTSGQSPEGYRPFVPAWATEQWKAEHPDADAEQPAADSSSAPGRPT
jgi:DNA-binding transcriptional MocR family regulator